MRSSIACIAGRRTAAAFLKLVKPKAIELGTDKRSMFVQKAQRCVLKVGGGVIGGDTTAPAARVLSQKDLREQHQQEHGPNISGATTNK